MTWQAVPQGGESVLIRFGQWALSFIGGAGAAFVFFRTRLTLIEKMLNDIVEREKKRDTDEVAAVVQRRNDETVKEMRAAALVRDALGDFDREIGEWLHRLDSRQMMSIRILADLAKKAGIGERFQDEIVQMIADGDALERKARPRIMRRESSRGD